MTVRIAFLILRTPFYRILGPVIDAAIEDPEFQVTLLIPPPLPADAAKADQTPTVDNVPECLAKARLRQLDSFRDYFTALRDSDVVMSIVGPTFVLKYLGALFSEDATEVDAMVPDCLWAAVFDGFHSTLPRHGFKNADLIFWPAPYFQELAVETDPEAATSLNDKSRIVGFTKTDQLAGLDGQACRAFLGVPADRLIVVYVPDGFLFRNDRRFTTPWYTHFWAVDGRLRRLFNSAWFLKSPRSAIEAISSTDGAANVVRAARSFCDRNDAHLLVAHRRKKDSGGEIRFTNEELAAADTIIPGGNSYPQNLLRAIKVADLVVCGYRSETVLDAASAGVPFITVAVPTRAFSEYVNCLNQGFDAERGQWNGVAWVVEAKQFIETMPSKTFADFAIDSEEQVRYQKRILGPMDGEVGKRILAEVREKLADQDPRAEPASWCNASKGCGL